MTERRWHRRQMWDAPQRSVPQDKRGMLGDRPGQLSQLPPPSAGTAPTRHGWAYILPCRGRAVRRSCRPIIRHTTTYRAWEGHPRRSISSQHEGANRTGAALRPTCGMQDPAPQGFPVVLGVPSGKNEWLNGPWPGR